MWQVNKMTLEELFETIEIEFNFECNEMGWSTTDFNKLQEFIIEVVLETWGLGIDQRKAVVNKYEIDRCYIFPFYVIDGGKA